MLVTPCPSRVLNLVGELRVKLLCVDSLICIIFSRDKTLICCAKIVKIMGEGRESKETETDKKKKGPIGKHVHR